ncbi:PREDICTED: uncharacterized protein LOC109226299 [Nicotiana attenuata]|uniref:DUF7866 domain-containing protein n=1 Tax=Nicotiana attenuata TaxID=49451 RepID=A0A1J6J082_NICAT|nr:PREDICTED: uncharacterized protein LOC109226299 [Nicotiana attenuata]OIT03303.1 hypothetical protein A4A49_17229 [Nicotiana attenuata]
MSAAVSGVLFPILFLAFFFITFNGARISHANGIVEELIGNGSMVAAKPEMVPLIEEKKMMMMMLNESRRKLGSFQICALCTCCGGAKGYCLPSPCCYAINCNIPNRPFGFCSFTPKTCNCFGCHL